MSNVCKQEHIANIYICRWSSQQVELLEQVEELKLGCEEKKKELKKTE